MALMVIVVLLALTSVAVPQLRILAEDAGGGGH
jgi:hypothetical protein